MSGTVLADWSPRQLSDPELLRLVKTLSCRTWPLFATRVILRSPSWVKRRLRGEAKIPDYLRELLEGIATRANQEGRVAALLPLLGESEGDEPP